MTKKEARAALVKACAAVRADPERWPSVWADMVQVQQRYRGALSLEPLWTLKPAHVPPFTSA